MAATLLRTAREALVARGDHSATGRAIAGRWGVSHTAVDRYSDPASGVAVALGDVLAMPRALAVEGWKGRWQDMGVDFWWYGLHDNDFEELAQVIWSQLRAISPGQVIDDARPGWHRTSPGPTAEERYDAFVARGARMIHGVLQLPSSEGGAT